MLRFLIGAAAMTLLMAGNAQAKRGYGMAGCGLGSLVIKPSGSQSSAATTNGTSGNQTFGITSGTSNCISTNDVAVLTRQENFVVANLGSLSKEMAQGGGESLTAFSVTLGCQQELMPQFAAHLQQGYADIFRAPGAMAILDATKNHLREHHELARSCKHIHI